MTTLGDLVAMFLELQVQEVCCNGSVGVGPTVVLHSQPDQKEQQRGGGLVGVTGDITGKKNRDSGEGWAEMRESEETMKSEEK